MMSPGADWWSGNFSTPYSTLLTAVSRGLMRYMAGGFPKAMLIGVAAMLVAVSLVACNNGPQPTGTALPTPFLRPMPTATPTPESTVTPALPPSTPSPTEGPGETPTPAPKGTATAGAGMSPAEVYALISPSIPFVVATRGQGSGVLTEGGYVVTNYHVVWPDGAVGVVFPDGTEFENVPVVGWDPMSDLALLGPVNVSAQPVRLEDGESTPNGSELFMIGYPAEVDRFPEPTITSGVLSNVREWEQAGITYLQTDSAIAGGQSGGALVNSRGEVIGITGFSFSEANYALVASAADIAPIIEKLVEGESTFGLGQRRLPQGPGSTSFDLELRNLWDTREFVFEAEEGSVIEIEIEGEGDGMFTVSTPFEHILEVDDTESGVEHATLELSTGGVHFLQVELAADGEPSRFRVISNVNLKPLNDPDDGRAIAVGETLAASLDHPSDWDWYSIDLREGDTVRVTTDSLNVDTLMYVAFPGSSNLQTVSDDDSGGGLFGLNSEIVYRAPHTGEYFIVITEAVVDSNGGYFLSVETAPEDSQLTIHTPVSVESERLANLYYDCILSNEGAEQAFLSAITEALQEDGVAGDEARAMVESILESRELLVSIIGLGIQTEGVSEFEELLDGHCDDVQPPGELPMPPPVPGPSDTFGRYFRGETLHVSVADLERVPELRYSTIDPSEVVRRWSLLPSAPGNELVLVRLKVENHTADSATIDIDGDAAELLASDGASYRPLSVSETVWQDFRGDSQALVRVDEGQCFDGARALVDAGTTIHWQNEAGSGQYLDFEDEAITVGSGGRVELNPGGSISYEFSDPGVYSYTCSGTKRAEWPAEIWVTPSGEQESMAVRSVLFLEGGFELQEGYGLDGYLVFEAPAGKEFHELAWRAGDTITIPLKARASQGDTQAGPTDLPAYAAFMAGGPGAIYIGDINQLVGPAPTVDQGDLGGNVPLESLERHLWLYESPLYEELLEKARLTGPTPMTYDGPAITIQHVCINRALLPCQLMKTYLAPNLRERTNGKLELITSSFPELGLAGPDTLSLVADGTLDSATVYGGYIAGQIPEVDIQNLWGIYSSREQEFDASLAILKDIEDLVLAETGGVVMNHSWYADSGQFLFCRERIDSLDGFVRKSVRSHSAALSDWLIGMGAEPRFVAFAEVYDELERGSLDCAVTGALAAYGQRWYEVTDYMIGPLLNFPPHSNVIEEDTWNSIPADLQQILLEEAARSELEAMRLAAIQLEQGVTENQDAGLELIPFSQEILNHSFETAAMEHVIPAWMRRMGPAGDLFIAGTFNSKLGPIVGLRIEPDGSVVRVSPQATHERATADKEREPTASPVSETLLANLARQAEGGLVEITAYDPESNRYHAGTGFVFATSGSTAFAVTYAPFIEFDGVVSNRIEVRVKGADTYQATVLEYDSDRYVAVMSICCDDNFTALEMETAGQQPRTGTQAIAVGYPEYLGRASSDCVVPPCAIATAGKILSSELTWRGMFAHDAQLNSGYFGGPLVSTEGKVWGVNVGVSSPSGIYHTVPYWTLNELLSELTSTPGTPHERPYFYEPISPPTIPADISWLWNPAQDGFRTMEWEFTIHNDTADWPGHYGYSLNTYNVISNVGFLFGLDTDRWGNRLRFQRQVTSDRANARYSMDDECFAYASLEYDYVEVECSYDWGMGEYRARMAPDGLEADGEWYGLWITDLNNNETTWIGSLKFPLQEGTTAFFPPAASTSLGLYGASTPVRPIDLPQWHVSVGIPQGDGITAIGSSTRYPSDGYENALLNSNVRYDSSDERVHLVLGGATERITEAAQIPFE